MSVLVNFNGTVQDGVVVARNVQGAAPQTPGVSFDLIQLRSGARVYACPMPHAEGPCVAPSHANPRPTPLMTIEIYESNYENKYRLSFEDRIKFSGGHYGSMTLPYSMLLPEIQRELDRSLKHYHHEGSG
jgi:hypothetical protein